MDAGPDLPWGRLEQLRERGLRDQLRGVGPDDEDAQQVAGRLVADDLDEAFGFAQDDGLGIADQWEFSDLDRYSLVFGLLLRQSEACPRRIGIGRARHALVVERRG